MESKGSLLCSQEPTIGPYPELLFKLIQWSRVLLEKLIVTQPVKKFPTFYGTQRFITRSQEPVTGPYPELDEFSPQLLTLYL
jgi:hypothetical protein